LRASNSGNGWRHDLTAEESNKAGVEKSRLLYFGIIPFAYGNKEIDEFPALVDDLHKWPDFSLSFLAKRVETLFGLQLSKFVNGGGRLC
jgi:hypothetical protein